MRRSERLRVRPHHLLIAAFVLCAIGYAGYRFGQYLHGAVN